MKKYYSEICEVMHKETEQDFKRGLVSEAEMREFDELCLFKEEPEADYAAEKSTVLKHVTA